MDIEDPRFEAHEARFRALAEQVDLQKGPQSELASARRHLFLYGDNGIPPEEEMDMLAHFEEVFGTEPEHLRGLEIRTAYWEDIALYLP